MKALTIEGQTYNRVKRIGSGLFTWAYLLEDGRVLTLTKTHTNKRTDYSKEAVDLFADHDNPHVPDVDYVGDVYYCGFWCKAYVMPYYKPLSHTNRQTLNELVSMLTVVWGAISQANYPYEHVQAFIDDVKDRYETLGEGLESIYNALCDYADDYIPDFHNGNFREDDEGNLIILDGFCSKRAVADWR